MGNFLLHQVRHGFFSLFVEDSPDLMLFKISFTEWIRRPYRLNSNPKAGYKKFCKKMSQLKRCGRGAEFYERKTQ